MDTQRPVLNWMTQHGSLLCRSCGNRRGWLCIAQPAVETYLSSARKICTAHSLWDDVLGQVLPVAPFWYHPQILLSLWRQLAALTAFVLDVLYGIADGLPAVVRVLVHLKMRGDWQEDVLVVSASDKDEPLPELRDTVIYSVKNAVDGLVSQLVKLREDNIQHCSKFLLWVILIPLLGGYVLQRRRHDALYILHDKESRSYVIYHADEIHEQTPTGVIDSQTLSCGRERLARGSAAYHERFPDIQSRHVKQRLGMDFPYVAAKHVMSIGSHGLYAGGFKILSDDHIQSRLLQPDV